MNDSLQSITTIDYQSFFGEFVNEWNIALEFNESSSAKLKKVLKVAKENSGFGAIINLENDAKRDAVSKCFKVVFKASEFLEFRAIYDVVKSWKSTVVKISGAVIDKKTLSKLQRCYTDKVKLKDSPSYCYGVSPFTFNPFGCHRIRIHDQKYNPWYHYIIEQDGKILIDKKRILQEIRVNLEDYRYCPVLNPKEILENLMKLPNEIRQDDPAWVINRNNEGKLIIETREEVDFRQTMVNAVRGIK